MAQILAVGSNLSSPVLGNAVRVRRRNGGGVRVRVRFGVGLGCGRQSGSQNICAVQCPAASVDGLVSLENSETWRNSEQSRSNSVLERLGNERVLECCERGGEKLKIAVLVSGGVDSSVALRLLCAAGHHCTAFYLKIWFKVMLVIFLRFPSYTPVPSSQNASDQGLMLKVSGDAVFLNIWFKVMLILTSILNQVSPSWYASDQPLTLRVSDNAYLAGFKLFWVLIHEHLANGSFNIDLSTGSNCYVLQPCITLCLVGIHSMLEVILIESMDWGVHSCPGCWTTGLEIAEFRLLSWEHSITFLSS